MRKNPKSSMQGAKQVYEVLNSQNRGLADLFKHAKTIQFLDQKLAGLLDAEMSPYVQVATVRDHCLVLVTSSAALATRLKMDSDILLKSLYAAGVKGISQIKVRIAPINRTKVETRNKRELPDIAKLSLENFAKDIGDENMLEKLQ
ncbi:MAG: hypothetical protein ACI9H8_000771 [Lysobacterales bacterium]|jgi:hypothetical protein